VQQCFAERSARRFRPFEGGGGGHGGPPWHAEDYALPYMADPRHAADTLFFVAEEDFRI